MVRSVKRWTAVAALTVVASAAAWAAAVDGKWTWNQRGQGGNETAVVLELKADGEKLTGTLTRGDMKTEIKEGTIKGNDIAFVVVRVRNNVQENKSPYKGKLDGDKITGTYTTNRGGEERTNEWVATRVK
jgi:opacity protein-like surface antigen